MTASQSSMSGGGEPGVRTVVWFRRDLRVEDNPALAAAARTAGEVVPAYVWSPEEDEPYYPGRVSRWWLSQSLKHLDASLRRLGAGRLVTRRSSDAVVALIDLVRSTGATHLFFNRLYGSIPPLCLSLLCSRCCFTPCYMLQLFLASCHSICKSSA
jgi:cryptochrome 1